MGNGARVSQVDWSLNVSVNNLHYNLELLPNEVQQMVSKNELTGPTFIGQGLCMSVGSDYYGFYIVEKRQFKNKTIWGIIPAKAVMHSDWTEGTMDCSIDIKTAKPSQWFVQSGWMKDDVNKPKYYYCNKLGQKYPGQKCSFNWNGARQYLNPSF